MKKIIRNILFMVLGFYAITTMISQQKILNAYVKDKNEVTEQITQANEQKQELNETKENADSLEYIEEIARDKLGMYLPNERVYVDSGR